MVRCNGKPSLQKEHCRFQQNTMLLNRSTETIMLTPSQVLVDANNDLLPQLQGLPASATGTNRNPDS